MVYFFSVKMKEWIQGILVMENSQNSPRWGYTTGTCAAAASQAAAVMLFGGGRVEEAQITTPKGITVVLPVEIISAKEGCVCCGVKKDGGDDPDATTGLLICVRLELGEHRGDKDSFYLWEDDGISLRLYGGEGVGLVTKPGLSCPVGKPAVNPVPRRMIFEQTAGVCRQFDYRGAVSITVFVPGGRECAEKTFNPHMGIKGGISILGTSGMVEPMSQSALLETIRLELGQKHLEGHDLLILTPGNYGEAFLRDTLKLNLELAVKCSNFIGDTIDMAAKEGIKGILLVGHGGKLIKLAAGIMNTHSSVADGRMEVLAAYSAACGAETELVEEILGAVSVDEALRLLDSRGLKEKVMERVMERIAYHLRKRAAGRLKIEALVFTNTLGLLGATPGAQALLETIEHSKEG